MKESIILIGASGHAKVVKEAAESCGVEVYNVFDDNVTSWLNFEGIGIIPRNSKLKDSFIVSIGDNSTRKKVVESIIGFPTKVIHSSAIVSPSAIIGRGTCLMAGGVIQADSLIGMHCIINTSATVDHDCIIEDYVHISPNATLCGGVYVGEGAHIGAGSVIIPGIKIGKWAIIGAGSVIIENVADGVVVVGNPGRVI